MASVFERNGRWYLRVRGPNGTLVKVASKARGKTEARVLAGELERRYERQRLGLEPVAPTDGGGTVAELLNWWLETCSKGSPSHDGNERSIKKHLLSSELGPLLLTGVTPAKVEAFLHRKGQEELAAQTVNHIRAFLSRAFNSARRLGRYSGPNPIATVGKRRILQRLPEYLRAEEVPRVLRQLAPECRPLFATAIYTGLRKGELLGLRKTEVDVGARLLTVSRSHARDTTKGGHADAIPIALELVPYLEQAIRSSPTELVFPATDGSMRRRDTDLANILRRALGRAGIVIGYKHTCRKKGCRHAELAPDAALRRCSTHQAKLWPKPQVRPIRFHDLRHTTASLLMMAGANPAAVRRIMRHSDPKMTDLYAHLAPEYLRAEVDRLSFGPHVPDAPLPEENRAVSGADVPNPSPPPAQERKRAGARGISPEDSSPSTARDTGFEPVAFGSGGGLPGSPALHSGSQVGGSSHGIVTTRVHESQSAAAITKKFVPKSVPASGGARAGHLASIRGGADDLLTVREVATRLGVSTATVYKLCERQELAHVRVSNAIRVVPADLEALITRQRIGG